MNNRLITFLVLCKHMNYRVTAEELNMSQPAVTKQIQSLEDEFGVELFSYDGKQLNRSEESYILEKYAISQKNSYENVKEVLNKPEQINFHIGMTKTIGEYSSESILSRFLAHTDHNVHITIANTEKLLSMLRENQIDFALLEGNFDKNFYDHFFLSNELFTGICSRTDDFAFKSIGMDELLKRRLICREEGSGSRQILENQLHYKGHKITDFQSILTVNSTSLIEKLVQAGSGITFGYDIIASSNADLASFTVTGISSYHEFNIASIAESQGLNLAKEFLDL